MFSGVPRDENAAKQKVDKKSLAFDYVDSDMSSDETPYDNLGKFVFITKFR